jgi:hypothetical protein
MSGLDDLVLARALRMIVSMPFVTIAASWPLRCKTLAQPRMASGASSARASVARIHPSAPGTLRLCSRCAFGFHQLLALGCFAPTLGDVAKAPYPADVASTDVLNAREAPMARRRRF